MKECKGRIGECQAALKKIKTNSSLENLNKYKQQRAKSYCNIKEAKRFSWRTVFIFSLSLLPVVFFSPPAVFLWPSLFTFLHFLHFYSSCYFPLLLTNCFNVAEWSADAFLYLPTYPQCIAFSFNKLSLLTSDFLISYSMLASIV